MNDLTVQSEFLTPATVLALHREVWDMPALIVKHPHVTAWLLARWEVHFDDASRVVFYDKATGHSTRTASTDVREALVSLLEAQIRDQEVTIPTPREPVDHTVEVS